MMTDSVERATTALRRARAAEGGRARECAQRISREVRFLMKNVPVSGRNAQDQLIIAWELENAARAIRSRIQKKRAVQGGVMGDEGSKIG